jgi:hypothetical protein
MKSDPKKITYLDSVDLGSRHRTRNLGLGHEALEHSGIVPSVKEKGKRLAKYTLAFGATALAIAGVVYGIDHTPYVKAYNRADLEATGQLTPHQATPATHPAAELTQTVPGYLTVPTTTAPVPETTPK